MPYKISELPNVPIYRRLKELRVNKNFNQIIEFVTNKIEETNQQDELFPLIENDNGQLIFFQSGSGENYDENWQKIIVKNIIPDIDKSLILQYIDTEFREL
jgi:hypothetical protein